MKRRLAIYKAGLRTLDHSMYSVFRGVVSILAEHSASLHSPRYCPGGARALVQVCLLQPVAQLIGLLGIRGVSGHGGRSAAIAQYHSHILQIQIANQGFIVGLQRVKGPVVAVPCHRQQRRFHVFSLYRTVEGAEPIHQRFELGRHSVIVQRSCKHHHICIQDFCPDSLHIVFLGTGAFIAAVDASGTGMNIGMGHVDHLNGVAGFLCALPKTFRQQMGGPVPIGTAQQ